MNATTSPLARIAGVAIVLILAAALGLMAGNVLNARGPAGGPGPFPNVWGNHADIVAADGVPAYADPYRQIIRQAAANDAAPVTSESWGNIADDGAAAGAPAYADPYRQIIRQAAASDADPVTSESWGNVADTSRGESLTAPTLR